MKQFEVPQSREKNCLWVKWSCAGSCCCGQESLLCLSGTFSWLLCNYLLFSHHLRIGWPTVVHLTSLCSPWCTSTIMFQLDFFVNNQQHLYSKRPVAMGAPEGPVAMQVRIHGFRRADRRHVCINIELQEGSDAALSLPSLAKLYRCKEVCFGFFFKWGESS